VPDVVTVGKALELLRAAKRPDTPSYIYIVDVNGRLAGVAPLRGLVLADSRKPICSIMVAPVTSLKTIDRTEAIIRIFNQYHYVSLPVVDEKDRLAGIVTFDDVMAAMRKSAGEVVRGVTGVDPREGLKETFAAMRSRIPWITVTIMGGLGCAFIGGLFQNVLAEMVVLGIFIPVVLALGESIGAQTTSVVLTTLVGGNLTGAALAAFVWKEIRVGLLVGLYSGVTVSLVSMCWHGNPRIGLLIGGAILVSVSWAALMAVAIPSMMIKRRVKPEIASGPLVLALADLSTLLVYFGGAALFMPVLK